MFFNTVTFELVTPLAFELVTLRHLLNKTSAKPIPPKFWGRKEPFSKKERFPCCHGDVRNAEQSHAHGVGMSETPNKVLPMALADIVTQQVNCF